MLYHHDQLDDAPSVPGAVVVPEVLVPVDMERGLGLFPKGREPHVLPGALAAAKGLHNLVYRVVVYLLLEHFSKSLSNFVAKYRILSKICLPL